MKGNIAVKSGIAGLVIGLLAMVITIGLTKMTVTFTPPVMTTPPVTTTTLPLTTTPPPVTTTTPPPPTAPPLRIVPPLTNATQVDIEGASFSKPTVTISVGGTVRWTNLGYDYHVVTSDTGLFESHALKDAETEPINASFSYTFTKPGTFNYYCSIHPETVGKVIVEAPPLTNATPVDIDGISFSKPIVTISVGGTVRWTNLGYDYHVVTSDAGLFESHTLRDAETEPINASFSYTFTEPGTFYYHCSIHPEMTGIVIVEAQ